MLYKDVCLLHLYLFVVQLDFMRVQLVKMSKGTKKQSRPLGRAHFTPSTLNSQPQDCIYILSGWKWWRMAQKARPFLQDVLKLVTFTPLY